MFVLCLFFLVSCASAKSFDVIENYETMNFEILVNNQIKYKLPFSRYCGYQPVGNRCYFIDCAESTIFEYGELCFFDSKSGMILYTGIMSGSEFLVTKKHIVASSLTDEETENDIEDVFGLGLTGKKYPLDITIYDCKKYKEIKSFDLEEYRQGYDLASLFINLIDLSDEKIKVEYGVYDTTIIIPIGTIDLQTLVIN